VQPTSEPRSAPDLSALPSAEARFAAAARGLFPELVRTLRRTGLPAEAAEDAAQGAFLIALEALPRIVEGRERAFLFATATRIAYGLRRRARRETANADLDLDPSPHPFPDELAQRKRFRERVHALLDALETPSRTVFLLFEVDELTIPEIARALAIAPDAARGRLRRARKDLRAAAMDPRSALFA
jgi:RNA polymerase sigma-70 factor (ECF subfamily)